MTGPEKARWAYWAGLTLGAGVLVFLRLDGFLQGSSAPSDLVLLVVFIALALAPLFSEVSMFGVTLKSQIRALKDDVDGLRTDVRNAIDVRNSFTPSIHFSSPPPDYELPDIETYVRDQLSKLGLKPAVASTKSIELDPAISLLASTRINIEQRVRTIAAEKLAPSEFHRRPIRTTLSALVQDEILSREMSNAIQEVYRVCSAALHGEKPTEAQVNFVRDVGADLIHALDQLI